MRLLPRRRRRGGDRDARPGLGPRPGPPPNGNAAAEADGFADVRAAGPAHWRRLPPLAPTVRRPALTFAGAMGVLADERNRPLIHAPSVNPFGVTFGPGAAGVQPPGRRLRAVVRQDDGDTEPTPDAAASDVGTEAPVAGRVTGLVVVRAEEPPEIGSAPEPLAPPPAAAPARRRAPVSEHTAVSEPAPQTPPAPARLVPRVLPASTPRPSLVKATDEYVGEPEPDATPHVSSAWLRMIESYLPPWANGGAAAAAAAPGAPGMPMAVPPLPEGDGSWSSEAPPPPRPPQATRAAAKPVRRASLAESRRLGLGGSLRPSATGDADRPEPTSQDTPAPTESADDGEGGDNRTERTETPALAGDEEPPPRPEPQIAARPVDDAAPAEAPRLGLAAPIARPVRRPRGDVPGIRPSGPPLTSRTPPPPSQPPQGEPPLRPGPHATGGATENAAAQIAQTGGIVEAPRPAMPQPVPDLATPQPPTLPSPAPPRRAEPVYRFVTGTQPTQAAATLARPTPSAPAPTQAPSVLAPTPPTPNAAQGSRPATPPASAPSPTSPADRSLTHSSARRGSDGIRVAVEPRSPARLAEPALPHAPAPSTAVPQELLETVRRLHGVDVSDVPIRRGPEVAGEARSLGARSFTRGGEVFLPAHEGSPDEPVARGLIAHELIHAAQQRVLGTALPAEDSAAGRALEAQAVAAERWARGLGGDPGGGSFGPDPAAPGAAAPPMASWTAPWTTAPTAGVQRQTGDVTSVAAPEHSPGPIATMAPASLPASDPALPQPGAQAAPVDHELNAARDRLVALSKGRPLDLDDPADIEELSVRIYQRIHRRLRRDLVVDRERAGRLGETGPFGAVR